MKGLLIKDFKLLKIQKKSLFVILAVAIGVTVLNRDVSFLVGYLSFIMPLFGLGTISYDEFDNGNAFLFTLPISREGYVIEKYCFCMLLEIPALLLSILLSGGYAIVNGTPGAFREVTEALLPILALVILFLAIMLPIQIKFGTEKARTAKLIVFGGTFALGLGVVKLLELLDVNVAAMLDALLEYNMAILMTGVFIIAVCAILLSIRISIAIIRKKEF